MSGNLIDRAFSSVPKSEVFEHRGIRVRIRRSLVALTWIGDFEILRPDNIQVGIRIHALHRNILEIDAKGWIDRLLESGHRPGVA